MDVYDHIDGSVRVVCGGRGCVIHEWNLHLGQEMPSLRGHSEPIFSLLVTRVSAVINTHITLDVCMFMYVLSIHVENHSCFSCWIYC